MWTTPVTVADRVQLLASVFSCFLNVIGQRAVVHDRNSVDAHVTEGKPAQVLVAFLGIGDAVWTKCPRPEQA